VSFLAKSQGEGFVDEDIEVYGGADRWSNLVQGHLCHMTL
jgi:hypothetical protein